MLEHEAMGNLETGVCVAHVFVVRRILGVKVGRDRAGELTEFVHGRCVGLCTGRAWGGVWRKQSLVEESRSQKVVAGPRQKFSVVAAGTWHPAAPASWRGGASLTAQF